jgi:hypothetical protein
MLREEQSKSLNLWYSSLSRFWYIYLRLSRFHLIRFHLTFIWHLSDATGQHRPILPGCRSRPRPTGRPQRRAGLVRMSGKVSSIHVRYSGYGSLGELKKSSPLSYLLRAGIKLPCFTVAIPSLRAYSVNYTVKTFATSGNDQNGNNCHHQKLQNARETDRDEVILFNSNTGYKNLDDSLSI